MSLNTYYIATESSYTWTTIQAKGLTHAKTLAYKYYKNYYQGETIRLADTLEPLPRIRATRVIGSRRGWKNKEYF